MTNQIARPTRRLGPPDGEPQYTYQAPALWEAPVSLGDALRAFGALALRRDAKTRTAGDQRESAAPEKLAA